MGESIGAEEYKIKGGQIKMMEYCGCGSEFQSRGFLTRAEKVEMLKEYKDYLDKESKGVSEKIKEVERKD